MKLSAILPLKTSGRHYADNIARCDILFSSLRAFTTPDIFDRFLIVVPHDEVEDARRYAKAWSDFPVEIIDEAKHFGVFKEFGARHQIRNWHRQQIIKLYASELVDTEYILVFDPDCFATRPFTLETLLPGGRALTFMQPRPLERRYWECSGEVLRQQQDLNSDGIWMTPAILSKTLLKSVHARLEELYSQSWMRVLLARYTIDWTEYTLYWLNAERLGLIDTFHEIPKTGETALHTDESIWFVGSEGKNLDRWDAAKHFAPEAKGIFAVIQSNTGYSIDEVVKKLSPFMPITIQQYDRSQSIRLKIAELYSAGMRRSMKEIRKRTRRATTKS